MKEINVSELLHDRSFASLAPDKIALIASFGAAERVTRSLLALINAVASRGYQPILIRSANDVRALEWPDIPPADLVVIRRPNVAYDFGSWAAALEMMPQVRTMDHVIFANDSLIGPFASIDTLIDRFESTSADMWGAVTNPQVFPHIQTFLYGFKHQTLNAPVMREFWGGIRVQPEKMDYVYKYELGLNRALYSEAFIVDSSFSDGSLGYGHVNPTLDRWKELIRRGFPFLKRALLTDSTRPERAAEAMAFASDFYGTDIVEWM
jgi:hypothetical protein